MRPRTSTAAKVLTIAAVAAVLDWLVKALATVTLDDDPVEVGSLVTLRLSHNPGVAFGMGDWVAGPVLIAMTAVVTFVLGVAAVRGALGPWWAAGLVLGGAFANLVDRVIGGTVVDFVDLEWWPSFNLADVWLTVGCVILVLLSLRSPAPAAT